MDLKDLIDIRADELRVLNENEGIDVTKEALTLIKEAITNLAFAYKYMSVEGDVFGSGTPVTKLIEAEKKSRDAKRKVNTLSKNSDVFKFTPDMKKILSMAVNSIGDALRNIDEKVIAKIDIAPEVLPTSDDIVDNMDDGTEPPEEIADSAPSFDKQKASRNVRSNKYKTKFRAAIGSQLDEL